MSLFVDSANLKDILRIGEIYPIDGVTTNPSLLAKAGGKPYDVLRSIRNEIGFEKELFVQTVSGNAEEIVKEAERITREVGKQTLVKVPCMPEGFRAMKELGKNGIRFIGTVVYTPMQGYIAAMLGAEYVAPYVNRIDNMGYDGISVAEKIQDMLVKSGSSCRVLSAGLKNTQQLIELIRYGIADATVSPLLFDAFFESGAVFHAVERFQKEFESLTSAGSTMETI